MSYGQFICRELEERIRDLEASLLEWMLDDTNKDALARIEQDLTYLSALDRREPYRKLWWLSSGMAEAMRYDAIDASALVKHLLARVLAELRAQRNGDPEGSGADRCASPSPDIFDDIITALSAPTTRDVGPIMRNISNEFSLAPRG